MADQNKLDRLYKLAAGKILQSHFYFCVQTGELSYEDQLHDFLDLRDEKKLKFPDIWSFISREDQRTLMCRAALARRHNRETRHVLYVTTGIGREVWLQVVMCSVLDQGQTYLVGTVQDVTKERIFVGELEKSAKFFESIVENIPNMIFVKEAQELRFVRLNRAGETLLGMSCEKLLGKNDHDFFPEKQAAFFAAKDRKVLDSGKLEIIEEEPIETQSGKRILRTKKIPMYSKEGEPLFLLGISEDITERKASDELIREQREALMQASKMSALGEMAGGIAHEINNPLAIMRGYADFVLGMVESGKAVNNVKIAEYCEKIISTTDRVAKIIKGLRGFARDGVDDPMTKVSVGSLVSNTLEFCRERFKFHSVEVRIGSMPQDNIICQETQISQVLLNLLNNAFDAVVSTKGAWIAIEAIKTNNVIRVYVKDSGKGIPKDIQEKVMQPFFTTKDVGKGTGLGLSISKGIVETHNGRLFIDDSAKHTSICVELPIDPKQSQQVS